MVFSFFVESDKSHCFFIYEINPKARHLIMSYKAGIVKAISELKDRTGSSSIAIKKHMQANLPADKKWMNAAFLKALKDGVEAGDFVKVKASYKLSAAFKEKSKPKKKAAPKKTAPKKKTVSARLLSARHTINIDATLKFIVSLFVFRHRRRRRHPKRRLYVVSWVLVCIVCKSSFSRLVRLLSFASGTKEEGRDQNKEDSNKEDSNKENGQEACNQKACC